MSKPNMCDIRIDYDPRCGARFAFSRENCEDCCYFKPDKDGNCKFNKCLDKCECKEAIKEMLLDQLGWEDFS